MITFIDLVGVYFGSEKEVNIVLYHIFLEKHQIILNMKGKYMLISSYLLEGRKEEHQIKSTKVVLQISLKKKNKHIGIL